MDRIKILEQKYNTFRTSKNLNNNKIHVKELLFVLKNKLKCNIIKHTFILKFRYFYKLT